MLVNVEYDDRATVELDEDERPAVVRLNHMPREGDEFVTCRGTRLCVWSAEVRVQDQAQAPAGLPSGQPHVTLALAARPAR